MKANSMDDSKKLRESKESYFRGRNLIYFPPFMFLRIEEIKIEI